MLCLVGKRGQLIVLISELTAISYFMILVLIVVHDMEMWPVLSVGACNIQVHYCEMSYLITLLE